MNTVRETVIALVTAMLVLPSAYASDVRYAEFSPHRSVNPNPTYQHNRYDGALRIAASTESKKTPEGPTPPGGWKDRHGKNMCWSEITKRWHQHGGTVTVTAGVEVLRVYKCNDGVWEIIFGAGKSDKEEYITK